MVKAIDFIITQIKRLPCFGDVGNARSYAGVYFPVLDGVRALAALLVITQHVFHSRPVYGVGGVYLFLVLSGLLLSQNWYATTVKACWRFSFVFILRRLFRIIPMYIMAVYIMAYILPRNMEWVLMHLSFQWSEYVLWTIKQELLFYVILPLLFLPRQYGASAEFMTIFALAIAVVSANSLDVKVLNMGSWRPNLQGQIPFFLGMFTMGVAAGSFIHTALAKRMISKIAFIPAELTMLVILSLIIMLYIKHPIFYADTPSTWQMQIPWAFLIAIFLVLLLLKPDRVVARILSSIPAMAIGVVGYSFYLLHLPIIRIVERNFAPQMTYEALAYSIVITYAASCVAYCLVERPCMRFIRKRTPKTST
jgi:peptidoglycan/LPS O-acetylase OafA/YrhL